MSGSAPANFSGSLHKFHPGIAVKNGQDDGIVSDESISECDEEPSPAQDRNIIYRCTWPGCSSTADSCAAIESHVRSLHLGPRKTDDEVSDHEEEFYYTEEEEDDDEEIVDHTTPTAPATEVVESSVAQSQSFYQQHPGWMASSPPTLSHMDMARPPHEGIYSAVMFIYKFKNNWLFIIP